MINETSSCITSGLQATDITLSGGRFFFSLPLTFSLHSHFVPCCSEGWDIGTLIIGPPLSSISFQILPLLISKFVSGKAKDCSQVKKEKTGAHIDQFVTQDGESEMKIGFENLESDQLKTRVCHKSVRKLWTPLEKKPKNGPRKGRS